MKRNSRVAIWIKVKENLIFWLICFLYFMSAIYFSPYPTSKVYDNIKIYGIIFIPYLISFIFIFWAAKSIIFLYENKSEGLVGLSRCWGDLQKNYLSRETALQFLAVFPLIPFFNFSYSSLKQTIPIISGKTLDAELHKLDLLIHGGRIPWDLLQPMIGHPVVTRFFDVLYLFWGSLFLYTLLWMTISRRRYLRIQFLLSLVFSWCIIGNIMAHFLSSAGPCYFSKVVNTLSDPYAFMKAYLNSVPNLKAVTIQNDLWKFHIHDVFMPLGGISAMPSMHVSIAVLLALVYYRINIFLGITFTFFAIGILIGSVHLGWHYAIDGYVAIIATIMIWIFINRFIVIPLEKCSHSNPSILKT